MRPLQCNGRHKHVPIEGDKAHPARSWTWEFAARVASVVRDFHRQARPAYPCSTHLFTYVTRIKLYIGLSLIHISEPTRLDVI
eukprot:12656919-Prorocentrum_lima.AAC.1